ncbi:MAG: T9SS type A sorting domain-containing protein [Flavobacteriales bacterium]|nr:T9SS type A sorting domain-containing protein [Flavobacteriales bacterium]
MKKAVIGIIMVFVSHTLLNAQGFGTLNNNNINASINTSHSNFWDLVQTPQFEVPKGSGLGTIFSSTVWIGGKDASNNVYSSAVRFLSGGNDFYPGPVMDPINYVTERPNWERVWHVRAADIQQLQDYIACVNNAGCDESVVFAGYTIPQDILDWPANGNVSLGQEAKLAPYMDANTDGFYDPNDGDYPIIKGDEALFYIINDDDQHASSGGDSMRIELHVMAYTYTCLDSAMNNTLFMNYKIYNRSTTDYQDVYLGSWTDLDVGNPQDDYIGCDSLRGTYYGYNGDIFDEDASGALGYGSDLAAQAVVILAGPLQDADGIDNPVGTGSGESFNGFGYGDAILDNERLGMSSFLYHNNDGSVTGDPSNDIEYYGYMTKKWRDNSDVVFGGTGHSTNCTACTPTSYMFPTPPDSTVGWNETIAGNSPFDRRGVGAVGPFTFNAGDTAELDLAYVFGRKYSGTPYEELDIMMERVDSVRSFFAAQNFPCVNLHADSLVWPGDANNDGIANVFDIIPVGLGYNGSGPIRQNASTAWVGQPGIDWGWTAQNNIDAKHADADGNGIIDFNDVLPILSNYGLTHNKGEDLQTHQSSVNLSLDIVTDTAGISSVVTAIINLGDQQNSVDSVYAIVCTINYDPALVDTTSVHVNYSNSWLGDINNTNDMIKIDTNLASAGKVEIGLTRTNQMNTNGFGEIAAIDIITIDDLSGKQNNYETLNLTLSNVKVISYEQMEKAVSLINDSLVITDDPLVGTEEIVEQKSLRIFPNPSNGEVTVLIDSEIETVRMNIMSITGEMVYNKLIRTRQNLNLSDLNPGTYIVSIESSEGIVKQQKLVLY